MKALSLQQTDLARMLQSPWAVRLIRLLNVLLIAWIAWLLATLTWQLLPQQAAPGAALQDVAVALVKPDPHAQLIHQLPDWHLFGAAQQAATASAKTTAPIDAPDTRLKLVLRGALASANPKQARAIIADPRGKEERYAVGDQLPGNAELSEILPDRVILKRNGRYETLRLPRDDKSISGRSTGQLTMSSSADTSGELLKDLRQRLRKNPRSLQGLVNATPKQNEDGGLLGYTLNPGRDPELFEQMGLQPGDVIMQVNDVKLDAPSAGVVALKSAQSGDSLSVVVMRDGAEQTISISVPE